MTHVTEQECQIMLTECTETFNNLDAALLGVGTSSYGHWTLTVGSFQNGTLRDVMPS